MVATAPSQPARPAAPTAELTQPRASSAVARQGRHIDLGWLLLLLLLALLSRVFTTNSLAGEPTSDEYLYGIHARDVAHQLAAGQGFPLAALADEGRLVVVESGLLSLALPWDTITTGRTIQALFNALCIPATFLLARRLRLPRGPGVAAALLLLAAPEFQESAWRFWTDSQATLFGLLYLSALARHVLRRATLRTTAAALLCLVLLVLTKESAAVEFAPFALLLFLPLLRAAGRRAGMVSGGVLAGLVIVAALVLVNAETLSHFGPLQRTFASVPLVTQGAGNALHDVPNYAGEVAGLISPDQIGVGFTWTLGLGYLALLLRGVVGVYPARERATLSVSWLLAALVWLPAAWLYWANVAQAGGSQITTLLIFFALLVMVVSLGFLLQGGLLSPWGLLLIGAVVGTVVLERLLVEAAPKVGATAALTFRSFMPIVPLLAILGGYGIWTVAGAWRLLLSRDRVGHAALTIAAAAVVVLVWSPLRERTTSQSLIGRIADRGDDPTTPQGLRVEDLVAAGGWLRANIRPSDSIITGIPRHLAWYAGLDTSSLNELIDLGSQPRTQAERREYIQARAGPTGVDYVIDFNVLWTQPDNQESRDWRQTYAWLASQPNIEIVYLRRDSYGNPVFYVARNNGYAAPLHAPPAP